MDKNERNVINKLLSLVKKKNKLFKDQVKHKKMYANLLNYCGKYEIVEQERRFF